jgi:hypothetical protein
MSALQNLKESKIKPVFLIEQYTMIGTTFVTKSWKCYSRGQ